MSRAALAICACTLLAACARTPAPPWSERPAGPLAVRTALAPETVEVLAETVWTLDLWHPDAVRVELPEFQGADFAASPPERVVTPLHGGIWEQVRFRLRPLRAGELSVPSLAIRTAGGAGAPAVVATGAMPLTARPRLADPKSPIEAPGEPFGPAARPLLWIGLGALALAVLAAVVWLLRRRRRLAPPPALETALPPHTKALRALGRLRQAPRITRAQIEVFYVELAQILRIYLEERFALHAPERTTEEFLTEAERSPQLRADQRLELRQFLQLCDLVKFARVVPEDQTHTATLAVAEAFVAATRSDQMPQVEGAA